MSAVPSCLLSLICLVLSGLGDDSRAGGAAQCQSPAGEGMIPAQKEFYDKCEYLYVTCETGYRLSPSYAWIRCINPQTCYEWDQSLQCIEKCKKPSIENLRNISPYQEYYTAGEEVTLQCKSGYYPSSDRIRCVNNGARDDWTTTAVCIGVNVTDMRVTRTGISLTIVCTPDQWQHIWTSYITSCIYPIFACKSGSGDISFSDLEPFTPYTIIIRGRSGPSLLILQTLYITTGESAPAAPEIVQTPSMETGTIVWRLSNNRGNITGFELNIVAWRDYNPSFSLNVTERFPPNVTQYSINLQHGTNYTLRLRGSTSGGYGEYTVTTIETPIGDFPVPLNSTVSFSISIDVASLCWVTIPIFTMKLLVLVVLMKIQCNLRKEETSAPDLDRKDQSKRMKILYRRRGQESVMVEEAADIRIYENQEDAAHS